MDLRHHLGHRHRYGGLDSVQSTRTRSTSERSQTFTSSQLQQHLSWYVDRHFSNVDRHPDSIHLKLQPICQRIQDEYLQALDPTAGDHDQAHPGTTIVLITYAVIMMQKRSCFYKEILTWYGDIYTDHLLGNFGLRQSFITETIRRNDFRIFLSHQDLTSSAGSLLHQGLVIGERNRACRHHHPAANSFRPPTKQIEKSTLLNEIAVFLFTNALPITIFNLSTAVGS